METENKNWKGIIYMETDGYSKEDIEAVMETMRSEIEEKLDGIKVVSCDVKSIM